MEEWKAIPGYEGLYEASNFGRIRTAEGKTTSSARFPVRVWKQRILKVKTQKRNHANKFSDERVTLWKDGVEKTKLVSRLVAMAWCQGYSDGMTVNHIDGNPMNNNASNLEWLSLRDNIEHGFANGLYTSSHPCALVDSEGNKICFRSLSKASQYLGRNQGYLSNCMKKNRSVYSSNGEEYGFV